MMTEKLKKCRVRAILFHVKVSEEGKGCAMFIAGLAYFVEVSS